ncbi:MAG: proprotein convertase P-domain-containing protein [Dokdonella sp.]
MKNARAVALCAGLGLSGMACAVPVSFPGTNVGAIPDNLPVGITVNFATSGIVAPVGKVTLSITLTHTYIGDLSAVLTSPGGVAHMVVFGRIGASRSSSVGDDSDFGGTYNFADDATSDIWQAAAVAGIVEAISPGDYFPSSSGAPSRSDAGGCPTSLTGVFEGLAGTQANGTWTLKVVDSASGDTGTVTAATLTLDAQDIIFQDGFESTSLLRNPPPQGVVPPSHCINKVQADFTGDGLTDYATARAVGTDIAWTIHANNGDGTANPAAITFNLGTPATDFLDTMDIDGDRIADAVAWTPTTGVFHVRRSSRLVDPVVNVQLGQNGDDPANSGDFDGDQRDDLAVFRAPSISESTGPTQLLVRLAANGHVQSVPLGLGLDGYQFVHGGYDLNGDGLADIYVQRSDPNLAGGAIFTFYDGLSGVVLNTFAFGKDSDFIIPGNYTGDALSDITVSNTSMGQRNWYTRDTATGTALPVVIFSVTGDSRIGGDYDGDGLSDHAIWRDSMTPGASAFMIRPSTSTATIWTVLQGEHLDYAVAGSRVK